MKDSYISLTGADPRGRQDRTRVNVHYIESTDIEHGTRALGMDAILVPGGFGERGIEGRLPRCVTRANKRFLSRHLPGMQLAVIEYGRHVLGLRTPTAPSSIARAPIR